jgi:hypothetical protein
LKPHDRYIVRSDESRISFWFLISGDMKVQFKTSFKTQLLTIISVTIALNSSSASAGTKDGGGSKIVDS